MVELDDEEDLDSNSYSGIGEEASDRGVGMDDAGFSEQGVGIEDEELDLVSCRVGSFSRIGSDGS